MLRYFAGWKSAAWQMRRFIQNQQPGERLHSSGGWRLEAVENGGPKMGMPVRKELFREHACGYRKLELNIFPKWNGCQAVLLSKSFSSCPQMKTIVHRRTGLPSTFYAIVMLERWA